MRKKALLFALGLLGAGGASASSTYTDLTSFLAAVQPNYYLETFNSTDTSATPASLNFSGNGFSYTASAALGLYTGSPSPIDGQLFGTNVAGDPVTFTFTSGNVTAVGGYFFLTDIANNVVPGTVTLNFSDGTSTNLTSSSSVPFLGYVSDTPLSSLAVSGATDTYVALDNLYAGASTVAGEVPEPSTLALLGLGALALGALKPRRRA